MGGIPVKSFYKLDIGEYRIYPDFGRLNGMEETEFTRLWKRCYSGRLSISVKNIEDWSFSIENMNNITNCGSYYYNEGEQDRKFLDSLYIALKNANQPVELKKNP